MFLNRFRFPSSTPAEMPNLRYPSFSSTFSPSVPCTVACQFIVRSRRSRSASSSS